MLTSGAIFTAIATVLGALIGVFSPSTGRPKLYKRVHREIDLWEKLPGGEAKEALAALITDTVRQIVDDERPRLTRRVNRSNVGGSIFFLVVGGGSCVGLWFWYQAAHASGWGIVAVVVLVVVAGVTALATAALLSQLYAPKKESEGKQ